MTVVGVIADVKEDRFNFRGNRAAWYVPYAPDSTSMAALSVLVRTTSRVDINAIAAGVREAIRSVDGQQPVARMIAMPEHLAEMVVTERFSAALMTALATLGLFLAACGLSGVIAYSVSQRTAELGLRIALGADRRSILRLVLARAMALVIAGLLAGGVMARVLSTFPRGSVVWHRARRSGHVRRCGVCARDRERTRLLDAGPSRDAGRSAGGPAGGLTRTSASGQSGGRRGIVLIPAWLCCREIRHLFTSAPGS